jgi:hypothetical protein
MTYEQSKGKQLTGSTRNVGGRGHYCFGASRFSFASCVLASSCALVGQKEFRTEQKMWLCADGGAFSCKNISRLGFLIPKSR